MLNDGRFSSWFGKALPARRGTEWFLLTPSSLPLVIGLLISCLTVSGHDTPKSSQRMDGENCLWKALFASQPTLHDTWWLSLWLCLQIYEIWPCTLPTSWTSSSFTFAHTYRCPVTVHQRSSDKPKTYFTPSAKQALTHHPTWYFFPQWISCLALIFTLFLATNHEVVFSRLSLSFIHHTRLQYCHPTSPIHESLEDNFLPTNPHQYILCCSAELRAVVGLEWSVTTFFGQNCTSESETSCRLYCSAPGYTYSVFLEEIYSTITYGIWCRLIIQKTSWQLGSSRLVGPTHSTRLPLASHM